MNLRILIITVALILGGCSAKQSENSGLIPSGFRPSQDWKMFKVGQVQVSYFRLYTGRRAVDSTVAVEEEIFTQLEQLHIFPQDSENFEERFRRVFFSSLAVRWVKITTAQDLSKKQLKTYFAKKLNCRSLSNREFAFYFRRESPVFDENFTQAFHLGLVKMMTLQKQKPLYPKIFSPILAQEQGLAPALQISTLNLLEQKFPIKNKSQGFILCLPNP